MSIILTILRHSLTVKKIIRMKILLFIGLTLIMVSCMSNPDDKKQPQTFQYQPKFKQLKVDTARLERIDNLLQNYVDQSIIPHALTFVTKNDYVIHHKSFGWRNIESQIPLEKFLNTVYQVLE